MFRKRQRTVLEQSLRDVGIDLHGDLGKVLLKRLLECEHSERTVVANNQSLEWYEFTEFGGNGETLASVSLSNRITDHWFVYAWNKGDYGKDLNACEVYSECDLFGNRIDDV